MNPHMGVTVQMSSSIQKYCSLSVSVVCDRNGVQRPNSLQKFGSCDYVTQLRHPSGCAKVVSLNGGGWGWFGIFLIIILFALGSYVIAGAAYRYFVLHVHGIDAIPNLEFWTSLPHRARSLYAHIEQKIRGPSHVERSTYNPIGF
ncbi:hypothetical protein MLD38_008783 [Melastoma candidum]|uniref:Uncharacterized protein n=1 Tax=Melastoma candidum TaxID=119954 RepID=A0ACB9RW05_9MYRT|nr:hypothetical protein MLD38_008783 [Melastoma candidum]